MDKKKMTKEVMKPLDTKKIREILQALVSEKTGIGVQYSKAEKLIKKMGSGEKITHDESQDLNNVINSINPFQTHKFLIGLIKDEGERYCMMEFAGDIAKEYDCKTSMELSLCETIASSYFSMTKGSQHMQRMYDIDYLSNEKNGYYSMISKEVEKQGRLYMTSIMTLRALKSPISHLSIRTKNAFIGENQQFNHDQNNLGNNL